MFSAECPNCGRVLLSTRAIRGLAQTPLGMEVVYHCACGHEGAHLTGRRSLEPQVSECAEPFKARR